MSRRTRVAEDWQGRTRVTQCPCKWQGARGGGRCRQQRPSGVRGFTSVGRSLNVIFVLDSAPRIDRPLQPDRKQDRGTVLWEVLMQANRVLLVLGKLFTIVPNKPLTSFIYLCDLWSDPLFCDVFLFSTWLNRYRWLFSVSSFSYAVLLFLHQTFTVILSLNISQYKMSNISMNLRNS